MCQNGPTSSSVQAAFITSHAMCIKEMQQLMEGVSNSYIYVQKKKKLLINKMEILLEKKNLICL